MRKNHKGMTVVEVVVSFAMISLSLAMGMAGIACGANYVNAGAKLKNTDRKTVEQDIQSGTSSIVTIAVQDPDGNISHLTVTQLEANGFRCYRTTTTTTTEAVGGSP